MNVKYKYDPDIQEYEETRTYGYELTDIDIDGYNKELKLYEAGHVLYDTLEEDLTLG